MPRKIRSVSIDSSSWHSTRRPAKMLWSRVATVGVPIDKRHIKATYANPSPATDGRIVVASFGSQGVFAYDVNGQFLWKVDPGPPRPRCLRRAELRMGPRQLTDHLGRNGLPAVRHSSGLLPARSRSWRPARRSGKLSATRSRHGERHRRRAESWPELVTNGSNFIRGYDPKTGEELWRLGRSSKITAPTPIFFRRPDRGRQWAWPGATHLRHQTRRQG